MPRVNTYEPTELEALEIAHEAVLEKIEYLQHRPSCAESYARSLLDSAYWIRNRLGVLREEVGKG